MAKTRQKCKKESEIDKSTKKTTSELASDSQLESLAEEIANQLQNIKSDEEDGSNNFSNSDSDGDITEDFVSCIIGNKGNGPATQVSVKSELDVDSSEDENEIDLHTDNAITVTKHKQMGLTCSLEASIDPQQMVYMETDPMAKPQLRNAAFEKMLMGLNSNIPVMEKSIITSDYEKKNEIMPYEESKRRTKKQRKLERDQTKGRGWFEMRAPEMTEELRNDLNVLQMRRILDPKRFYKGPDRKGLPKYFQMGKIIEAPADFYNSRVPKKERKKTIVDELLADAEFRQYNKRKYEEIQESRRKGRGAFRHMKRLKKRK